MANWNGLPSIVSALPADLRNFLQRVRETLDRAMAGSDRFVTVTDLVNGNIAATDRYGNVIPLDSAAIDTSIPPTPTGLVAAGALATIMLQWDDPLYNNHAHTEIWRASTDDIGQAVLTGTASGVLYADPVDAGSTYYYWIRFVSRARKEGAYNATAGTLGQTSADPSALLSILTSQITASQLASSLGSRINLIDAVNTGLVTQVGTANQSIDDMAAALIQSTLDKADLLDKLARERAISDATVTVDPLTGQVTLLAEAAITTDVEARITTVETSVNAAAGTANTAIARLDVIGTVDGAGVPQTGVLHAMNTAIEANTAGVALKVDSTYVNAALAGVNDAADTAVNLPIAMMKLFLAGGNAIPITQGANIRVAHAEQTLTTHTDQLSAEAQARLSLAALVDQNAAAIIDEQTARASADSAIASDVTQLQARLDTGDFAAVKTESSASASAITGLSAEYSLKLDVNGFVSGYGTVNDGSSSEFLIATNQFGIIAPTLNSDTEPATKYHGLIWKNTSAGTVAGVPAGSSRRWVVVAGVGAWQLVGFGALPFAVLTTATTINGTVFQPGVYIDGASVVEATIGNAQLANLAVDDAKIANLSANKLTAGSVAVGEYIQSTGYVTESAGWRIHGDGSAEFANIYARGNIRATSFSAITLNANEHIKYGQTAFNTGTGFFLGDDGSGVPVLSLGVAGGNGVVWDGATLTINGGGTFSGALSAATGTFAGELSAATGTFSGALTADAVNAVNTINLAGQAVTIPVSSYSAAAFSLSGTYTACGTATIESSGAPIQVRVSCRVEISVVPVLTQPQLYVAGSLFATTSVNSTANANTSVNTNVTVGSSYCSTLHGHTASANSSANTSVTVNSSATTNVSSSQYIYGSNVAAAGYATVSARIVRSDGTVFNAGIVARHDANVNSSVYNGTFSLEIMDTPGAGTFSYAVQALVTSGGSVSAYSASVSNRNVIMLETKR